MKTVSLCIESKVAGDGYPIHLKELDQNGNLVCLSSGFLPEDLGGLDLDACCALLQEHDEESDEFAEIGSKLYDLIVATQPGTEWTECRKQPLRTFLDIKDSNLERLQTNMFQLR